MDKLKDQLRRERWYIKDNRLLSFRRLCGLAYLLTKRRLGFDYAFSPPGKSSEKIDIYIPAIEKDINMIGFAIDGARANIMHPINTIHIVSPGNSTKLKKLAERKKCKFVAEESVLPFSKEKINYRYKEFNRNGWIYQMLLNLSSDTVCSQKNILILNADTVFVAPQIFLYRGKALFNLSDEYNPPYFEANRRLLGLKHKISRSFITHYMIFNGEVLKQFRKDIESRYKQPWYDAIINNLDRSVLSSFADFEVYGDYYCERLKRPRQLNYWSNISLGIENFNDVDKILASKRKDYRSVSLHNQLGD